MFSNILLGAAGFPVADLGDTVSQSLRFNRNQWLASPAVTLSTYTASIWLKLGRIRNPSVSGGVTQIIIGTAGTGGHGVGFSNNKLYSTHTGDESTQEFRDPSGWYHLVINSTGNLYINGVEIATGGGLHDPNSEEIVLGHIWPQNSQNSTYAFEGLLANYHFIDGQELTPTSFGRTNEDGVWVPKNYTGTYGTNGARLIFDSSAGIGNDTSGNNNDYSIGGTFDTADVALYSSMLTSSETINEPTAAFSDTSLSTSTVNAASITFTPSPAISCTSFGIQHQEPNMTVSINGGTAQNCVGANGSFTDFTVPGGSLTSAVVSRSGGTAVLNWQRTRINGSTLLLDNTDNDVDFLDTPTSNYGTYNPLSTTNTLEDANLHSTAGSYIFSPTTFGMAPNTGKYYYEVTMETVSGNQTIGACTPTANPGVAPASNWVWAPTLEDIESPQGGISNLVDISVSTIGTAAGTTYMIAYDSDTQEFWVGDNGNWYKRDGASGVGDPANGNNPFLTTSDNCVVSGETYCPCTAGSSSGSTSYFLNVGQMNFLYTVPTGFNHLQTNNLPEPTIKNGKEHFGVVTYTGDDSSSRSITGLDFQPDFVWIKKRNGDFGHSLFDSIRGVTKRLLSNASDGEITNSNYLASFNTDGFSVNSHEAVNNNNDTYVAWCWKAGGTAVSNSNGTITSSVSANTDAGFSIITYTGNGGGNAATVGHGLTKAPEMLIAKRTDSAQSWAVYHKDVGNDRRLSLHNNDAQTSSGANYWNNTSPTNSVFSIGSNINPNPAGDYVVYAWHSVPGYSAFGSYTANGTTDNAFCYCGFRPACLIIKRFNGTGDWSIVDTTRDINNPVVNQLRPNLSNEERQYDSGGLDILSNGFKIRQGGSMIGDSGFEFVWAAFAENPFGGENAPPVTAR